MDRRGTSDGEQPMSSPSGGATPDTIRGRIALSLDVWRWSWNRIWSESRGTFMALGAVTLARGIVPAAAALVLKRIIDIVVDLGPSRDVVDALGPWLGAAFVLAVVEAVSRFVNDYCAIRLADDLDVRLNADLMQHAGTLDVAYFEDSDNRDVIDRANRQAGKRLARVVSESQNAVTHLIQALSLLAVLVSIEPWLLAVVPPFAIPFFWFQWRLAKLRYREAHRRATKRRWTRYYLSLVTGAYSVQEIRLLRLGPVLLDRFKRLLMEFRDRDRVFHLSNLRGSSIAALLSLIALYALLTRVALRAVDGLATVGDLAIFAGGAGRLRTSLDQAIRSISIAYEESLAVGDVRAFLDAKPEPRRPAETQTGTELDAKPAGARLTVSGLSFSYPGVERPVLHDVSFEVAPGETLGLVGENGAGKTTLVKLLSGLYQPTSGRIELNGVPIEAMSDEALHAQISCVFQTANRFEATAEENIAFGDWERLLGDREAIEAVVERAGIDPLIAKLDQGLDTMLGRQFSETTLSGGEWQRIAIARAAARQASLLILDEPTASMDARAEHDLFARFKALATGHTTILISHRFSTIAMADRIIVLAEGRIVESGSHTELLQQGGTYATLYRLHEQLYPPRLTDGG